MGPEAVADQQNTQDDSAEHVGHDGHAGQPHESPAHQQHECPQADARHRRDRRDGRRVFHLFIGIKHGTEAVGQVAKDHAHGKEADGGYNVGRHLSGQGIEQDAGGHQRQRKKPQRPPQHGDGAQVDGCYASDPLPLPG